MGYYTERDLTEAERAEFGQFGEAMSLGEGRLSESDMERWRGEWFVTLTTMLRGVPHEVRTRWMAGYAAGEVRCERGDSGFGEAGVFVLGDETLSMTSVAHTWRMPTPLGANPSALSFDRYAESRMFANGRPLFYADEVAE